MNNQIFFWAEAVVCSSGGGELPIVSEESKPCISVSPSAVIGIDDEAFDF